jgi:hypothetical protein
MTKEELAKIVIQEWVKKGYIILTSTSLPAQRS